MQAAAGNTIFRLRTVILVLLPILFAACSDTTAPGIGERPEKATQQANQSLLYSKQLAPRLDKQDLITALDPILTEIARARTQDMDRVYESISLLAKQPEMVAALSEQYRNAEAASFERKLFLLQIIGQLKRNDALPFLLSIIEQPLPEYTSTYGYSEAELAEMLHVKAVHGIAYLRSEESYAQLLEIIRSHSSEYVQAEAIDAYLWNHDDSKEARAMLKESIPIELHKYIGMPRFITGMDARQFDRDITAWQKKWSTE